MGDTQSDFTFIPFTASQTSSPTLGKFSENMGLYEYIISLYVVLDAGTLSVDEGHWVEIYSFPSRHVMTIGTPASYSIKGPLVTQLQSSILC